LSKLLDLVFKQAHSHPGKMPVVYLGSVDRMGEKGVYQAPTLEVCDWAEFGDGASPSGVPLTSIPPLPRLTDQSGAEAVEAEVVESMDDEIPF
jgi:hypothetical protein